MKKLFALMLVLALMLGAAAWAEELPYIRELEQYGYYNATLLSEESYPQVCLMASYPFMYYSSQGNEPLFLCFPGPANAQPASFASYTASYLDMDNMIVYTYEIHESDSFEEFMNKAEDDAYIVLDGSDGVAAYIDPSDYNFNAYAMLYAKDFGKSAKLVIRIKLNSLDNKMPLDTRANALTEVITAEAARVGAAMHIETFAPYWSYGKFAGAKILSNDYDKLFTFDFQDLTARVRSTGEQKTAAFAPTVVDTTRVEGIYGYGDGAYATAKYSLESYSYPSYMIEEGDPNAKPVTLPNGSQWLLYMNVMDDGTIISVYGSKILDGYIDRYDHQYYFNLQFSGSSVNWTSEEECVALMTAFDENLTSVSPQDDPYVAPEKPEEELSPLGKEGEELPEAPVADAASWTCPACATENTGNFCTNCGAAKPAESAAWKCPSCGTENEGNFCSNCGAAKP